MSSAVLAIELSQRSGSVAVRPAPGAAIVELPVEPGSDARDPLQPAIDQVVRAAGIVSRDIGLVAVSAGPGGFTGLRISMAAAQALCFSLGARGVAVPSALVVARTLADRGVWGTGLYGVMLAGKVSSAWFERLEIQAGVRAPHRISFDAYSSAEKAPIAGVNSVAADKFAPAEWRTYLDKQGIPCVDPEWCAAACLAVAEELQDGLRTAAVQELLPIYPRPPEAVTLWEERTGRAAGQK